MIFQTQDDMDPYPYTGLSHCFDKKIHALAKDKPQASLGVAVVDHALMVVLL